MSEMHVPDINQIGDGALRTLEDVEQTMDLCWCPAFWRALAQYQDVLELFWRRVKPMVDSAAFVRETLALTDLVDREAAAWYSPHFGTAAPEDKLVQMEKEAYSLGFGMPQVLLEIQMLGKLLRGEPVGREGASQQRTHDQSQPPQVPLVNENSSPETVQRLYGDIRRTLDVSFVGSVYRALAQWPAFAWSAWEDIKQQRTRDEYRALEIALTHHAQEALARLTPRIQISMDELRRAAGDDDDLQHLSDMCAVFNRLAPEYTIDTALVRMGIAAARPLRPGHSASAQA